MTFLSIASFDAADAGNHPDALTRLRRNLDQAIVVRNVFSAAECAEIVTDLDGNRHDFPRSLFPGPFKSFFYGMNLNLADPALDQYFDAAPLFSKSLGRLMDRFGGYDARVSGLLSRIDEGRPVLAPPGPGRRGPYMITTFRGHEEGGFIPAHFDNEQRHRPTFKHLEPLIEGDLFSFVLTLARADRGGALEVFDAKAEDYGRFFVNRDTTVARPDIDGLERVAFDVEAGTIVLLRSGRYLHRVSRVEGAHRRWTACSFMAKAAASDAIYCWG